MTPQAMTTNMVEFQRIAAIVAASGGHCADLTPQEHIFFRDCLLSQWEEAKKQLEVAKEVEMSLRKQIVSFAFDPDKQSGTERIDLANGYELKAVKKVTYGWVKDYDGNVDKDAIETALAKIEKTGAVGELVASRLVKWNPGLSLTEYKQLDTKFKTIIDKVIVTDSGAPTLEIISPKAPK